VLGLCVCREWKISPRDVELWDAFLSSILKSSGTQDVTPLEILRKIANEMAGEPYVFNEYWVM